MNIAELVQDVQFTVDNTGHITAVVVSPELWQKIVELLEDVEDRALVQALGDRLAQHPNTSSALHWQDVEQEWE